MNEEQFIERRKPTESIFDKWFKPVILGLLLSILLTGFYSLFNTNKELTILQTISTERYEEIKINTKHIESTIQLVLDISKKLELNHEQIKDARLDIQEINAKIMSLEKEIQELKILYAKLKVD